MSMLLVDAGNSRLKWVLCENGQFIQRGAFRYDWSALSAQFTQQWDALAKSGTVEKRVLCNVAGERLESPFRQWWQANALQETNALTIETVAAQSQAFGVQSAYQQPEQLGADRWAALVAARHEIVGACCVIDCGTALTIDVLSPEGVHMGGLIAPGRTMMGDSLQANTAQIELVNATGLSLFSVKDTASAVQAGVLGSTSGAVKQVLQECNEHWQQLPVCVITGGDALALLPSLPTGSLHEPEWVLKGLAMIAGCHN